MMLKSYPPCTFPSIIQLLELLGETCKGVWFLVILAPYLASILKQKVVRDIFGTTSWLPAWGGRLQYMYAWMAWVRLGHFWHWKKFYPPRPQYKDREFLEDFHVIPYIDAKKTSTLTFIWSTPLLIWSWLFVGSNVIDYKGPSFRVVNTGGIQRLSGQLVY